MVMTSCGYFLSRVFSNFFFSLLFALLPSCFIVLYFFPKHYQLIPFFCYLFNSFLLIFIYKQDKLIALEQNEDKRRVPEKVLHLWSLLGGWPGAIYAQKHYHHKTQKQPFRFIFWLTVIINIVITLFIVWPDLFNPLIEKI